MLRSIVLLALIMTSVGHAEIHVCGSVTGVWTLADSPVYVDCDIDVPVARALTIMPGVEVLVTGHFSLTVYGELQAVGAPTDSILFSRAEPTEQSNWAGIRFWDTANDDSRLEYCILEYSQKGAGNDEHTNGGAVYAWASSPTVTRCTLRYNEASRGSAICAFDFSNMHIDHCLFYGNVSPAGMRTVWFSISSGEMDRCTLTDNEGGDLHSYSTAVHATNCIIWSGTEGIDGPVVRYSCVQGGYAGTGNISSNPLFADAAQLDFHLQPDSPCIDTGDPTADPDDDGSRADMGAIPYGELPPMGIRIDNPAGGDTLVIGATASINWITQGFAGGVSIELNRTYPGGTWETLTALTPNDGQFPWTVSAPPSADCRLRICSVQQADVCGESSADFAIQSGQGFVALVRASEPETALLTWNPGNIECPDAADEWFRIKNFGNAAALVYRPQEPSSAEFSRGSNCPPLFALGTGEMSACSVQLAFLSQVDGLFSDVLRIQSDAGNAVNGYVQIALTAQRLTTPMAPDLAATAVGEDVRLSWQPVTQSVGGCAVNVTRYLVFYSPTTDGPFYYHGWTNHSPYFHLGVITFAPTQYYRVVAVDAPAAALAELRLDTEMLQLLKTLRHRSTN